MLNSSLFATLSSVSAGDGHAETVVSAIPEAARPENMTWAGLILLLPAISAVLCGLYACLGIKNRLPGWTTVLALASSFVVVCMLYAGHEPGQPVVIHLFDWIDFSWGSKGAFENVTANFALYVDDLSLFWMLFVTGLGTCIAFYASEYMDEDRGKGYSRFFGAMSIFLLAMSALVLGDNLVMLYLGWEGVGLASYLLIGYYYQKTTAIDAAKKAFIMNRIGDLGLAIAIWLVWFNFGTLEYDGLFQALNLYLPMAEDGTLATTQMGDAPLGWTAYLIPWFLMVGAFGKSAQFPLMTWLPGRDGRTDTGLRAHPRSHHGDRRCLPDLSNVSDLLARNGARRIRPGDRRMDRWLHRIAGCHDRRQAVRHETGPCVLHHLTARIHVHGARRGADIRSLLPCLHPCVLQGTALPVFGCHHARPRRPA